MKHRTHAARSGFTIVELIVVIAIIGILAAITFVYFKGAKERSYNTQITQGVAQYLKAIQTYKGLNGTYPKVSTESPSGSPGVYLTCLGTGYIGGRCGVVTSTDIYEDAGFNAAIGDIIGKNVPLIGKNVIVVGGETFAGAVYGIDKVDPSTHPGMTGDHARIINYALLGEHTPCGVAGAYEYIWGDPTVPRTTSCEIYFESYQ